MTAYWIVRCQSGASGWIASYSDGSPRTFADEAAAELYAETIRAQGVSAVAESCVSNGESAP